MKTGRVVRIIEVEPLEEPAWKPARPRRRPLRSKSRPMPSTTARILTVDPIIAVRSWRVQGRHVYPATYASPDWSLDRQQAICLSPDPRMGHGPVPAEDCACGFYAIRPEALRTVTITDAETPPPDPYYTWLVSFTYGYGGAETAWYGADLHCEESKLSGSIFGWVELSGTVIEHDNGVLRASHARPLALWRTGIDRWDRAIERIGWPLVPLPFPLTDLPSTQGVLTAHVRDGQPVHFTQWEVRQPQDDLIAQRNVLIQAVAS